MSRDFVLPRVVEAAASLNDLPKNTVFVAISDMHGRFPLTFMPTPIAEDQRSWPVFQYDRESCGGTVTPRDMLFGFQVLKFLPHWKTAGGAAAAFARITTLNWGTAMKMPPLDRLERLHASSWIPDSSFIVLVRTPRPVGSRNIVPMSRRTDVQALTLQLALNSEDPVANARLRSINEKARTEVPHPTEAQLFLTRSGALVQGVTPRIVCTKCMARGHHMAHTHEEVVAPANPNVVSNWPSWMNIKPLPAEVLELPKTDDSKGFEVQIRQVTAHVPLRLARQMKLQGVDVQGDVVKCGVMEED